MIATKPLYVPALRMKAGELMGIRDLASDIADRTMPRLIVPPRSERDNELQPMLFAGATFPNISKALASYWLKRDVMVDVTHLLDEFGRNRKDRWLPKMFEDARRANARPTPLVNVKDLVSDDLNGYSAAIDTQSALKLGIVFSSGDLGDTELLKRALDAADRLRLTPEDCLVIADFYDADFSNAERVAPVIAGVLDTVQSSARWQQIVFQGTNFPETNPADPGSYAIVPRNEWIAWRQAVRFDPQTADHMIFGDYAADCAKIVFKSGGGAPAIRHYRYTTPDAWLVQRGSDSGAHAAIMRAVCKEILASGKFAGRTFSSADDHIFRTANDAGKPGGAREWRAINTTHHITRVVTDIGAIRGIQFGRTIAKPLEEQIPLFV